MAQAVKGSVAARMPRQPHWTSLLAGRVALVGLCYGTAAAHRLDEILQTSFLDIRPDAIRIELNLTPGVSSFRALQSLLDVNQDGQVSPIEAEAYADLVRSQLSLQLDEGALALRVTQWEFPNLTELQDGTGIIRFEMVATFPAMRAGPHEIRFANHHLPTSSVYLVNALQPETSLLTVQRQSRNEVQSQSRIQVIAGKPARESTKASDTR